MVLPGRLPLKERVVTINQQRSVRATETEPFSTFYKFTNNITFSLIWNINARTVCANNNLIVFIVGIF